MIISAPAIIVLVTMVVCKLNCNLLLEDAHKQRTLLVRIEQGLSSKA